MRAVDNIKKVLIERNGEFILVDSREITTDEFTQAESCSVAESSAEVFSPTLSRDGHEAATAQPQRRPPSARPNRSRGPPRPSTAKPRAKSAQPNRALFTSEGDVISGRQRPSTSKTSKPVAYSTGFSGNLSACSSKESQEAYENWLRKKRAAASQKPPPKPEVTSSAEKRRQVEENYRRWLRRKEEESQQRRQEEREQARTEPKKQHAEHESCQSDFDMWLSRKEADKARMAREECIRAQLLQEQQQIDGNLQEKNQLAYQEWLQNKRQAQLVGVTVF